MRAPDDAGMNPVDLRQYRARVAAWQRAPASLRLVKRTRDDRGRRCIELWAHGKCFTRIVDVGHGYCELYADKGMRVRVIDYGKISFSTWTEPEVSEGDGKPHGMPMVPRPERFRV
jgi:hypothetical protein